MKTHLLPCIAAIVLLASSCARYQMSTISSPNAFTSDENGGFVTENDSLKIAYSFTGRNAPISIYVYNKLDEPLYVDWQRSALVYNDSTISYIPAATHLSGSIDATSFGTSRNIAFTSGAIDAAVALPKYVEFVPPHAFIRRALLELATQPFNNIPDSQLHTVYSIPSAADNWRTKGKKATFTASNTPLKFSSYLTIYSNNSSPHIYRQMFYISELINTHVNPASLVFTPNTPPGSSFYVKQQTGYGKTMGTVGVAAATGAILGAAEALSSSSGNTTSNK